MAFRQLKEVTNTAPTALALQPPAKDKQEERTTSPEPFSPKKVTRKGSFGRRRSAGPPPFDSGLLPQTTPLDETEAEARDTGGPDNQYTCLNLFGTCKNYDVYKAVNTSEGKTVAWVERVKAQHDVPEDTELDNWFLAEIEMLRQLRHPHVLRLYDKWETPEKLVFVTDLMTGGSLHGFLCHTTRPRVKVIQNWARQLFRGLHYLHTRTPKVVHRDINTKSLFLEATDCSLKIGNLGFARCLFGGHKIEGSIGEPAYQAPEVAAGPYDHRADVYSAGITLLAMSTGHSFYEEQGPDAAAAAAAVAEPKDTPPFLETVEPFLLQDFIAKCVAQDPDKRLSAKEALGHKFFSLDLSQSQQWTRLEIRHVHLDGRIDLRLTKTSQRRANADTQQQLIDFTLEPGESASDVTESMATEGIILTSERRSVTDRIEAVVNCLAAQTESEDALELIETQANLTAELSREASPSAASCRQQLKQLLTKQARQRQQMYQQHMRELASLQMVLQRPPSPSSKFLTTRSNSCSQDMSFSPITPTRHHRSSLGTPATPQQQRYEKGISWPSTPLSQTIPERSISEREEDLIASYDPPTV